LLQTAVEKCGGEIWMTGRFKRAAYSVTMKHVVQYGGLQRILRAALYPYGYEVLAAIFSMDL